jgi:hypothetical protein
VNDVLGVPDDRAAYAGFWRRFAAYTNIDDRYIPSRCRTAGL